jgi:hypothetical protein
MGKDFTLSIIRHILTSAGTVLVAKGYIDAGAFEAIVGGVLAVVGLAWSFSDKKARVE